MEIIKMLFWAVIMIFLTLFVGYTTISFKPFTINIANVYAPIGMWIIIAGYLIMSYKK